MALKLFTQNDIEQIDKNNTLKGSTNFYEGKDIHEIIENEDAPLELLTIRDGQERCKIHRKEFEKIQIKYTVPSDKRPGKMAKFSITTRYCCDCNRLYIPEEQVKIIEKKLTTVKKRVHIFSQEKTEAFLNSQMSDIELLPGEIIYVPDVWIEENPLCPIHNERIEEYPYTISYENKSIRFKACFCEKCNKVIIRRTKAIDLQDMCAEVGIPMPKVKKLMPKNKKKKQRPTQKFRIHYYVEEGKKKEYTFENANDYYLLEESDTVVVSDSIYCSIVDHYIEEALVAFSVNLKTEGEKNFLLLAGYCTQCQKYYISEDDYKAIYALGRPNVNVLIDVKEQEYKITSGGVFELEKNHLDELETELNNKINEITSSKDFTSRFATCRGGFDDGELQFRKEISKKKYEHTLEKWSGVQPRPYTYRVDLNSDDENITYYLGPEDIQIDDDVKVISYNDKGFGSKLVNYRTVEIERKGKKYKVKLSRQFDIENAQLYGYVNIKTDEDIIFRKGITDEFLVRVLKQRKNQHNLVDIIATIQENQNAIVDERISQNIVVQGCAGSGKTMVLLHRLSYLKYNHQEYDFSSALILTPNEQFNIHIRGFVESLQIGFIDRMSIEQYYVRILKDYSSVFVPKNALASEVFVNQKYVDYIYSDSFKSEFYFAYEANMLKRQKDFEILKVLCEEVGEPYPSFVGKTDYEYMTVVNSAINSIIWRVTSRDDEINRAREICEKAEKELEYFTNRLSKEDNNKENLNGSVIQNVNKKIENEISVIEHNIEEQQKIIEHSYEEVERVTNQLLPFGKKDKLEEYKKSADQAEKKIKRERARKDEVQKLLEEGIEDKLEEDILEWVRRTEILVPDVKEDVRSLEKRKKEIASLKDQIGVLEEELSKYREQYNSIKETRYSDEVRDKLEYLKIKNVEYSEYETYRRVFEQTVAMFKAAHSIKVSKGTRRYDLYSEILFCLKYYNKAPGDSHFICVDEGQDLALNEYRLINAINNYDVVFNVYGDVKQLLKPGRGISDWDELEQLFSMKEFQLNENYRNTNQITRFCNMSFNMDVKQTGVDGPQVREIPRKDLEKELSEITINSERVAILIPRNVRRNNYLDMDIIPYEIQNLIGQKIDNGYISFMYVDEVKGIEFDKVFVVSNGMAKNEKYIAYTRALTELIIVVDESISEHKEYEDIGNEEK